jgi:hypothetical protein
VLILSLVHIGFIDFLLEFRRNVSFLGLGGLFSFLIFNPITLAEYNDFLETGKTTPILGHRETRVRRSLVSRYIVGIDASPI